MAEAMFRRYVGHEVRSAGVAAEEGEEASPGAVAALARLGLDVTAHRAQALSRTLVEWADLILTMTRRHKETVTSLFPTVSAKVFTLKEFAGGENEKQAGEDDRAPAAESAKAESPDAGRNAFDVADPFGQDEATYNACAAEIDALLVDVAKKLDSWPDMVE